MPPLPAAHDYPGWIAMLAIPHVSKSAFRHLVGRPDSREAVMRGLDHESESVRANCCRILDHLADEETFDLLVVMLDDPSPAVRSQALHALACDRCKNDVRTPAKDVVLPGAIHLLRHDEDKYVRAMAAEVVGTWAHDDAMAAGALADARDRDRDASVRKKAGWYAPGGTIFRKRATAARGT